MEKRRMYLNGRGAPIEKVGNYKGFKFVITLNSMGYRCGYVMIPRNNLLFLNIKSIRNLKNYNPESDYQSYLSKRVGDFDSFNVHGGITFENVDFNYPIRSKKRQLVLGFDTGHYGDSPDFDAYEKYYPEAGDRVSQLRLMFGDDGGVVRDEDYVESNCKNLINQLITTRERMVF